MAKISLLPGWGLGVQPLEPLVQRLAQQHEIQLLPLPENISLEQALTQLDASIPADAWLAGWSLGGMLATALAGQRGSSCPGLITLASNPCFVARADWPMAMSEREFAGFTRRALHNWNSTSQQFAQLCLQGESAAYSGEQLISAAVAEQVPDNLGWLAQLDNRQAMREMACPQLHLLAEADALVPAAVAGPLQALNRRAQVRVMPGSHAFVCTRHEAVGAAMLEFMRQAMA